MSVHRLEGTTVSGDEADSIRCREQQPCDTVAHPEWQRAFGGTGLSVSALGLGAGPLGLDSLSDADAERLLGAALDAGVTFWDTARSYGRSEERIGNFLRRHRPAGVVVSTKVGYGIDGVEDWTGDAVRLGVDEALAKLGLDVIDVVFLHSCDLETLWRGEVVDALLAAKGQGKVRAVGYSGDNAALDWAVESQWFDAVQTSVSLCDQRSLSVLPTANSLGLGVVAKRPLANAPWRFANRPTGDEAEFYWERWQELEIDPGELDWHELAVRFAAWHPEVDTAISGTSSVDHLLANVALASRGPLDPELRAAVEVAFQRAGADWRGRI